MKLMALDVPRPQLRKKKMLFQFPVMVRRYPVPKLYHWPQLDSIPAVCNAYRQAEALEVWQLERAVDVSFYPRAFWGNFILRDVAITRVTKLHEYSAHVEAFRLVVDALSSGEAEKFWDPWDPEPPTLAGVIGTTRFVPDLVFQFVGPRTVKVEFDLAAQLALVTADGAWGLCRFDGVALRCLRDYRARLETMPVSKDGVPYEPTHSAE
ncbi:MAG: hypothetical protein HZA31_09740 [Opitutae bacterium]|nr:hypothetical protein [Opitutae bacterium]